MRCASPKAAAACRPAPPSIRDSREISAERALRYHALPELPRLQWQSGSPLLQMWQQVDCDVAVATYDNPSGCQNDLFTWVEATVVCNGAAQPPGYDQPGHHEGPVAMGIYDVAQGDAAYFNRLAHEYALSDNFHQAAMGGTGAITS